MATLPSNFTVKVLLTSSTPTPTELLTKEKADAEEAKLIEQSVAIANPDNPIVRFLGDFDIGFSVSIKQSGR